MLSTRPEVLYVATPRPISEADVFARICVRPPYFALKQLRYDRGLFEASVRAERPRTRELGPIQGAELSRHAAIAGLCSAALSQGDTQRRYYLAQRATYLGHANGAEYGSEVHLRAELQELDKRRALALIDVSAGGEPLAALQVEYAVLGEKSFSRLFQARRTEVPVGAGPAELPEGEVFWAGNSLVRQVPSVPAEVCAGHFTNYPAMPVAILMGQLAGLAAQTLGEEVGYRIPHASVEASDFCWAGERARFEVTPMGATPPRQVFTCCAHANDRVAGRMTLTLEYGAGR